MEKILSILNSLVAKVTGTEEQLSKIVTAENRVKSLEADLATANASIAERDGKIAELTSKLAESDEKLQAAESRATETLAAQGIAPGALPDASQEDAAPSENAATQYKRLVSEGKNQEAARFFAENADEIFKSL